MSQFASNINWEEIAESQSNGIGGYPDSVRIAALNQQALDVQKQAALEKLRTSLKTNDGNLSFNDGNLSFFDKYKTYILVGAFIVVAVVGYFIYDKYFK